MWQVLGLDLTTVKLYIFRDSMHVHLSSYAVVLSLGVVFVQNLLKYSIEFYWSAFLFNATAYLHHYLNFSHLAFYTNNVWKSLLF
jgi:hypothetical protein